LAGLAVVLEAALELEEAITGEQVVQLHARVDSRRALG
jgi:hypothetical protein